MPTAEDVRVADMLAEKVVRHGLTVPSIMFLESVRPMNFIAGQTMAFFEPIVKGLFDWQSYTVFQQMLEHRGSIPLLMDRIERCDAARNQTQQKVEKAKTE